MCQWWRLSVSLHWFSILVVWCIFINEMTNSRMKVLDRGGAMSHEPPVLWVFLTSSTSCSMRRVLSSDCGQIKDMISFPQRSLDTANEGFFMSAVYKACKPTQSCVCVFVCLGVYAHWIEHKRACITTKWSQSEQSAGHRKDQYLTFIDMNSTWTHRDRLSALWLLKMFDIVTGNLKAAVTSLIPKKFICTLEIDWTITASWSWSAVWHVWDPLTQQRFT